MSIRKWALRYAERGFAIARIRRGQKRPTYTNWNRFSCDTARLKESDSIGIQSGRLSNDLVCVDLDSRDALTLADHHLPATALIEGRPGKRRSHRWYRVVNIPPELTAGPEVAGGLGGPRTRQFRGPDKKMIVEFRGTGSQAVVPPSPWVSGDGTHQERREWDEFGEPAVIDCRELFESVCRLAEACGWTPRKMAKAKTGHRNNSSSPPDRLPLPAGEAAWQARAYVAKMDPAVEGNGGDAQTYKVACVLVIDFGLSPEESLPLLLEYNERCSPPWSMEQLQHKLASANDLEDRARGRKVRPRSRRIDVNVKPDDKVVYVGVDCAGEERSYIDLSTMGTAIVKVGERRELVPELEAVAWEGKHVILTPPSTIATNKKEVWVEFFLARLLREKGATVQSFHVPPREGRLQTFARADGEGEFVDPPQFPWEAATLAEAAGRRARELDPYRKSLPRKKASPKLEKAIDFVRRHDVRHLTKDVLKKAKRYGIYRDSLRRALQESSLITPDHTPPMSSISGYLHPEISPQASEVA